MNQQAIHNVFENPEEILASTATTQPWTPFDIQKSIPHTLSPTYSSRNPYDKPKRPRQSNTYRIQSVILSIRMILQTVSKSQEQR
jgi:hypothetical protein